MELFFQNSNYQACREYQEYCDPWVGNYPPACLSGICRAIGLDKSLLDFERICLSYEKISRVYNWLFNA